MSRLKNENGAAMMLALIVMMVLAVLGTALWHVAMTETLHASKDEKNKQAYYLARTGAEAGMGVWLREERVADKPEGTLKRVYYNKETSEFQHDEPDQSGGYFDVTIHKIDDPESTRDGLTEVTSTGVVNGHSKTVTLVTFPYTVGHEMDPAWYKEEDGELADHSYEEYEETDLVIMSTLNADGFYTEHKEGWQSSYGGLIGARQIAFVDPLKIGGTLMDTSVNAPNHNATLTIRAERIHFDSLTLQELKSNGRSGRKGTVILEVPDGMGLSEDEKSDPENDLNPEYEYGRVYFDGEPVEVHNHRWNRWWLIVWFYNIESLGPTTITNHGGGDLQENAFFFRDGTDLLDIK